MTGLDIEAIRRRHEHAMTASKNRVAIAACASAEDVPLLLEQLARERAALAEALATVREQAAEVKKLREWNDEIKAERDALAERCLVMEAEIGQLTPDRDDAQAALADALQVIADLRGGTP